ncbi:MAG TPA: hypothetical protein VGC01_00525 [Mucilaginibacter sp.]
MKQSRRMVKKSDEIASSPPTPSQRLFLNDMMDRSSLVSVSDFLLSLRMTGILLNTWL